MSKGPNMRSDIVWCERSSTAYPRGRDDKLPSEAELMRQHQASRTVARRAIARLRGDGYAISHQGKGSFAALPGEDAGKRHSPEFEQLTEHLDQVLRDIRDLARRMDDLEAAVRRQSGDL